MLIRNISHKDTILYRVCPGDSLSKIIRYYYGPVSLQQQKSIISQIQSDNPQITNPNVIYPGQALLIDIPQQYCHAPVMNRPTPIISTDKNSIKPLQQQWQKATPQEKELLTALAPVMLGTGSAGLMMIDTTFKTNAPLVAEMAENYNDLKDNNISKGQYDFRRQKLLQRLKINLGPTQRMLTGGKPVNEVLRISRTKGSIPTDPLTRQVSRMTNLSKIASRGGIALSVAGLGVTCYQIANTDDKQEKNQILIESLGGFGGGVLYGLGTALVLGIMATPVGWVGALMLGAGGALFSYGSSQVATKIYTTSGGELDLVKATKIGSVCM